VSGVGLDWTLFAIGCLGLIAIMAYKFRIPFVVSLGAGWVLTYALFLLSGGLANQLIPIMMLLGIGIVIKIISGLMLAVHNTA
jgi:hypothetical protein